MPHTSRSRVLGAAWDERPRRDIANDHNPRPWMPLPVPLPDRVVHDDDRRAHRDERTLEEASHAPAHGRRTHRLALELMGVVDDPGAGEHPSHDGGGKHREGVRVHDCRAGPDHHERRSYLPLDEAEETADDPRNPLARPAAQTTDAAMVVDDGILVETRFPSSDDEHLVDRAAVERRTGRLQHPALEAERARIDVDVETSPRCHRLTGSLGDERTGRRSRTSA